MFDSSTEKKKARWRRVSIACSAVHAWNYRGVELQDRKDTYMDEDG